MHSPPQQRGTNVRMKCLTLALKFFISPPPLLNFLPPPTHTTRTHTPLHTTGQNHVLLVQDTRGSVPPPLPLPPPHAAHPPSSISSVIPSGVVVVVVVSAHLYHTPCPRPPPPTSWVHLRFLSHNSVGGATVGERLAPFTRAHAILLPANPPPPPPLPPTFIDGHTEHNASNLALHTKM